MSPVSEPSAKPAPDVAFMDHSFIENIFRFNPRTAFGDALWKCWTTFSANVHAPKENPNMDVTGVVLEVYNKTNPTDVKRLVAVEPSPYRDDKQYPRNTVVEGTDKRVADIYGNPTRVDACDKKDIKCDETTLVITEVGGRGASTEVKAECPNSGEKGIACDKWVSWSVEQSPRPVVIEQPQVEACPEGSTPIPNSRMCEVVREVIVPVPVNTNPGQAPR
jgi:hypothetical protein